MAKTFGIDPQSILRTTDDETNKNLKTTGSEDFDNSDHLLITGNTSATVPLITVAAKNTAHSTGVGGASANLGAGCSLAVTTQAAAVAATAGGSFSLTTGAGNTSGAGGAISVTGGAGGTTGAGAAITITAGAGGSTSGTGGAVTIAGGAGTAGNANGGAVVINGGAKNGSGTDGTVTIQAARAVAAGGAVGSAVLFSSTAGLGVYFGSGAPTVSAAQGSLYVRTDGSSTSTRLYVNTNGSTTWTNVTTAA